MHSTIPIPGLCRAEASSFDAAYTMREYAHTWLISSSLCTNVPSLVDKIRSGRRRSNTCTCFAMTRAVEKLCAQRLLARLDKTSTPLSSSGHAWLQLHTASHPRVVTPQTCAHTVWHIPCWTRRRREVFPAHPTRRC